MILVIGSMSVDMVTRVKMHPKAGETTLATSYAMHFGGKGANQAVTAKRMGANVRMVGRVGRDEFGEKVKANLQDEGINVRWVEKVDANTGVALISVDSFGQNMIVVCPGANHCLLPEDLDEDIFRGVKMVIVQLEIPIPTVRRAMELAHKQGALVLLNAAPVQPLTERDLQKVDVLVVNEIEAQGLAGCKVTDTRSARVAAHKLSQYIPKVVITLGGKGALWCTKYNEYGYQQAFDVHVVDTTGAGDAFVGALAKMLVQNAEWDKALRIATAAGALAVGRAGAQSSLPTQDEVNTMLEKMQIENQR